MQACTESSSTVQYQTPKDHIWAWFITLMAVSLSDALKQQLQLVQLPRQPPRQERAECGICCAEQQVESRLNPRLRRRRTARSPPLRSPPPRSLQRRNLLSRSPQLRDLQRDRLQRSPRKAENSSRTCCVVARSSSDLIIRIHLLMGNWMGLSLARARDQQWLYMRLSTHRLI